MTSRTSLAQLLTGTYHVDVTVEPFQLRHAAGLSWVDGPGLATAAHLCTTADPNVTDLSISPGAVLLRIGSDRNLPFPLHRNIRPHTAALSVLRSLRTGDIREEDLRDTRIRQLGPAVRLARHICWAQDFSAEADAIDPTDEVAATLVTDAVTAEPGTVTMILTIYRAITNIGYNALRSTVTALHR